jgi:hypothetical protein
MMQNKGQINPLVRDDRPVPPRLAHCHYLPICEKLRYRKPAKNQPDSAGFEQWLSAGMDKTRLSMSPH